MRLEWEDRISELLERMTLREKLGQLTQAETVKADRAEELSLSTTSYNGLPWRKAHTEFRCSSAGM